MIPCQLIPRNTNSLKIKIDEQSLAVAGKSTKKREREREAGFVVAVARGGGWKA